MKVHGCTPWPGVFGAVLCLEGCMANVPVNYVGAQPSSGASSISSPKPAYGKVGSGSTGSSSIQAVAAPKGAQILLLMSASASGSAASGNVLQQLASLGATLRTALASELVRSDFAVDALRFVVVMGGGTLSPAESQAVTSRLENQGRTVLFLEEGAAGGISSRLQPAADGSSFTLAQALSPPSAAQYRVLAQNAGVVLP